MPATVVDAVSIQYPCPCACHAVLTVAEREAGIAALYRFDDAMRGWGYEVLWDLAAPWLWRMAQALDSPDYRWVAVRDQPCVYSRLLGACVHELIHALCGDPTQANYGVPFGLPYGVPETVALTDEASYLHRFNQYEARAWVGLAPVAQRLYGVTFELRPAREVGTYGFVGGNAVVDVKPGYRAVPHYDSVHHRARYFRLARELEDEARAWFTPAQLDELAARAEAAEAIGRAKRPRAFPPPREMARLRPRMPGRNDLCPCGSAEKYKKCCGAAARNS